MGGGSRLEAVWGDSASQGRRRIASFQAVRSGMQFYLEGQASANFSRGAARRPERRPGG